MWGGAPPLSGHPLRLHALTSLQWQDKERDVTVTGVCRAVEFCTVLVAPCPCTPGAGRARDPGVLPPKEGLDAREEDATPIRTMTKQLCSFSVIERTQLKLIAPLEIENLYFFPRAAVTATGGRHKHMHSFSHSQRLQV